MPRQQLSEMADGNGDSDAQWRWQLRWPTVTETAIAKVRAMATAMAEGNATETAAAMIDGDCTGNGQRRRRWAAVTAKVTESAMVTEMAMAIAMAMVARATMTKGGLPLHVLEMCSTVAGATPCLHPHGHNGKRIHQCCVMVVTLLRVFAHFQGGGFLTAHHGFFFCLLFTTNVHFTEQPSVFPPHYSGTQEPCQPIDALPPLLLQESRQPIDDLPRLLLHFCQVSLGRACNDYNLTFLC